MGDGVLAYFGFPRAQRTMLSGRLEPVWMWPLWSRNSTRGRRRVSRVRIGIATGIVVVGDLVGLGSAQEQAAVGETPILRHACKHWLSRAAW